MTQFGKGLSMNHRYFGSVRFFKNIILLAVVLAITVPSSLAFLYHGKLQSARSEITRMSAEEPAQASAGDILQLNSQTLQDPLVPYAFAQGTDLPDYASLYPDFYAETPLTADQSVDKTIYLTFDDGPSSMTPEILKILDEENVKATFFVVGKTDDASLEAMREIVADGHTLGMHSYSHQYTKIYGSVEDFLSDMYDLFCLIRNTTGTTPSVFRMPGGSINAYDYSIYQAILAEMLRRGFVPCDWNLFNGDTESGVSKSEMIHNVVYNARYVHRGFVLMHDAADKKRTVSTLPDIIDGLREEGFSFDRITADTKPVLFCYSD